MRVIFLGKEWKFKKALQEEVLKRVEPTSIEINPPALILSKNTLIVCDEEEFERIKKIFDYKVFDKDSLLVEDVNIIKVKEKIPKIYFKKPIKRYIFTTDKEVLNKLNEYFINEAGIVETFEDIEVKAPLVVGDLFEHIVKNLPPKKITFAESCTGGLLASNLTKIPGSSKCFEGSVVSYANEIKQSWLGVKKETLTKYGAVSKECVSEMIDGALKLSKADYAIAISGIAGPTGATPTKPVGTVYIGVGDKDKKVIKHFLFKGDRNYIQYQAMLNGIVMFIRFAKLYSKIP
ncbi:MAG: CinA family protein [Nautiliaceae bacterium]